MRTALSSPVRHRGRPEGSPDGRRRLRGDRPALSDQRLLRRCAVARGPAVARRVRQVRRAAEDKAAAIRFLRAVVSEYPSSKFAKQAPAVIAAAEQRADAPDKTPSLPRRSSDSSARSGEDDAARRAANASRIVTIKDIRRVVLPDAVRIVIELDGEVPVPRRAAGEPVRVFVDLSATQAAPELVDRTIRFDGDADVVRQVRLGRHPNTTTRVVLDAAGVTSYSVYPLYSPYRLVIDFFSADGGAGIGDARPPARSADGRTTLADAFPGAAARATRAGAAGTSNRGADRYGAAASLCPAGALPREAPLVPLASTPIRRGRSSSTRPAPIADGGARGRSGDDDDRDRATTEAPAPALPATPVPRRHDDNHRARNAGGRRRSRTRRRAFDRASARPGRLAHRHRSRARRPRSGRRRARHDRSGARARRRAAAREAARAACRASR